MRAGTVGCVSTPRRVGPAPTLFDPDPPSIEIPDVLAVVFDRVVNVSHGGHADVYIGRTFAGRVDEGFGNSATFVAGDSRLDAIVGYYDWLVSPAGATVRARAGELTGVTLGCWCAPEPCHGWILAAYAAGLTAELAAWVGELREIVGTGRH